MSCFYLEVEATPGSDIQDAAAEAIRLAEHLGVTVTFKFNNVECGARASDNPDWLVAAYHRVLSGETPHKFAFANAAPPKQESE